LIVVAGRDKVLEKKISSSDLKKDKSIRTFGFVDNLEEYMTVADLILTKAGGLTVSECLVKNLPMIFNNVIPIQEDDNVEYSEKNGVGVKVNNVKETVEIIDRLFAHPDKIVKMKDNCKKIAKPNAAIELVDFVVSKI
ncbi:MAG: glycosyltransferase, partial [Candidatus Staskawiczbacteria bacterium]|nr:glycosyltransferase [Candidatus Staskawiczbacteria bacterium]